MRRLLSSQAGYAAFLFAEAAAILAVFVMIGRALSGGWVVLDVLGFWVVVSIAYFGNYRLRRWAQRGDPGAATT